MSIDCSLRSESQRDPSKNYDLSNFLDAAIRNGQFSNDRPPSVSLTQRNVRSAEYPIGRAAENAVMDDHRMVSGGFLAALAPRNTVHLENVTVLRDRFVHFGGVPVVLDHFHLIIRIINEKARGTWGLYLISLENASCIIPRPHNVFPLVWIRWSYTLEFANSTR